MTVEVAHKTVVDERPVLTDGVHVSVVVPLPAVPVGVRDVHRRRIIYRDNSSAAGIVRSGLRLAVAIGPCGYGRGNGIRSAGTAGMDVAFFGWIKTLNDVIVVVTAMLLMAMLNVAFRSWWMRRRGSCLNRRRSHPCCS